MTSTFRLISAEFKKIFKRPSVYIMALILAATIFLSIYIFNPTPPNNYTIQYGDGLTALDYHNTFFNDDSTTSEKGINLSFESTDTMYAYYNLSNNRDINIQDYHTTIINLVKKIRETSDTNLRENYYSSLKTNLTNLSNAFKDFSTLEQYPHINYTLSQNYYLTNYSHHINDFLLKTSKYNSFEIIEYYDSNEVEQGLNEDLNYAINYIAPTLLSMAEEMKSAYDNFNQYYEHGMRYISEIETQRIKMLTLTKNFKEYFEVLIDNDYPLIMISTIDTSQILSNLEFSINTLSSFHHLGETALLSEYTTLKDKLDSINYVNYFTSKFKLSNNTITQVKIDNSLLDTFDKVKTKVDKNKANIKDSISTLKSDESIKNIQFKITEYYLLSTTYNEFIYDSIVIGLSNNYTSYEFSQMYAPDGHKLDTFNYYEFNERITKNQYYIENNIYSNSFNNIFSFNQNSDLSNQTNVYDFMYFTMELCTIVIIVFSMFLIASFVSGETDSGTIKLLLVRPYKRSKIISSKLFATIFFALTFMIFSGLISFAAGYYTYGISTTNILAVFNSTTAFVISPLLLMIINIISLMLEVIFYILIALMISVLCKNFAGSIYISLLFIVVIYTLNVLFGGAYWYSFLPSMNLHLFKYFGNSFISLMPSVMQNIFITPIQSTMNFLYSILLTGAYSLIAIAVSYSVFNKRDF